MNGFDDTQTIPDDPALFPASVTVSFDWPEPNEGRALCFPALKAGRSPWTHDGTTIVSEVFISLHEPSPCPWTFQPQYVDPETGYTAWHDSTPLLHNGTQPILFIGLAAGSDFLSGTLDLAPILKMLVRVGILTGTEYVSGFEFGNESFGGGSGTMVINAFAHLFEGCDVTEGGDVLTGTVRGDDVGGPGGNDTILGNASCGTGSAR